MNAWRQHARNNHRPRFGSSDAARATVSWRAMRPIVLRTAGTVSLAGAVVAAIASAGYVGPDVEPQRAAFLLAEQDRFAEAATKASVRVAAASTERSEAAAGNVVLDSKSPTGTPEAVLAPLAPAADTFTPPDAPNSGESPEAEAVLPSPTDPAHCPRNWLSAPSLDAPAECDSASRPIELAVLPLADPALLAAASERASELMAAEPRQTTEMSPVLFAPSIPEVRPDPPLVRRQVARKFRANRPSKPPPACGRRHARWRYIKNVPTWYCR